MNPVAAPLVDSFATWRVAARALLADGVAPEDVAWQVPDGGGDLFSAPPPAPTILSGAMAGETANVPSVVAGKATAVPAASGAGASPAASGTVASPALIETAASPAVDVSATAQAASPLRLPRKLVELLETAACFKADDRWAFLYKVLWRWQGGAHDVISPADVDGARLNAMVKAVHREEHDMHAYVRFRERAGDEPPRFVAWFEPTHDVLPQVAQHFARRMGKVTWMIATPGAAVLWDGETLLEAPSTMRSAAEIDDGGEALWLTYYRSIFNPARLNAGLLRSHIPSRFWKNLPEGAIVPGMISDAANGARRTGQSSAVGERGGAATIAIAPARAQPARAQETSLDACRRCTLWQHATQAVAGVGPQRARIMLVGEQPGDQEDLQGKPFVGPAGAVLDQALSEAGIARDSVYVTNAVKHFKWEPRGKRRLHKTPAQQEVLACRAWLDEELASVQPQVIVALGSTALKAILQDGSATLQSVMGAPFEHDGRWIVAVYHPSYVLRVPDEAERQRAHAVIVDGLRQAKRLAAGASL